MAQEPTTETGDLEEYLECIRRALDVSLCIQDFPCQDVERHSRPEVEFQTSPELLVDPVLVNRDADERCFIEGSINSVRISIKIKQADELDRILSKRFFGFMCMRAEDFHILRRKPIPGYDLSFLVTSDHLMVIRKKQVIDFVVELVQTIDQEILELKKALRARDTILSTAFLKQLVC